MAVTLIYAGALALWFLILSLRVIAARIGPSGPGLGDGGNPKVLRRIRGHANFAEYVPLVLLMMGFLELSGLPRWWLHAMGAALLVGRLIHGYALSFTQEYVFGRTAGIILTLIPLLVGAGLCLYKGFIGL
ncbi:MAG: MAPEG family protein [Kiritimatiellae bacterium]|nr:MAPEG family protein [Kiritimatiellia bacterium]